MLIDNFKNWEKGGEWRTIFEDLLGNGIFNADGFLWKKQRKVASAEFSRGSLRDFMFGCFAANSESAINLMKKEMEDGGGIGSNTNNSVLLKLRQYLLSIHLKVSGR